MLKKAVMALMLGTSLLAGLAQAGENPNQLGGKFGLFGNVGYNAYAMEDLNDFIIFISDRGANEFKDTTLLKGGFIFNGGAQYAVSNKMAVGVEAGMLLGSAKGGYKDSSANYDATYTVDAPATEIGAFIKGMLPVGDRLLLNARIGVDLINVSATVTVKGNSIYETSSDANDTWTGSTVGIKGLLGGEYFLTDALSLGVDVGYRSAKVDSLTDKHNTHTGGSMQADSLDYSGVLGQAGLRFYF